MRSNIVISISPPIPCLPKFWFLSYGSKCCWPIKLQGCLICNISREKRMMQFIFGMQMNIAELYKLILSFWLEYPVMPKIPKTRTYLQKNMGDEVDFLPADKRKKFLQVDSISLGVCSQA